MTGGRDPACRLGGEAEIIALLVPLAAGHAGAAGLTDDAATLTPRPGHDLVLTTDAIAAGVHFFADDAAADIAWKALAVNVSDLSAKGARPVAYQMALSFPEAPTRGWMTAFADGLARAQAAFGITLSGGDTDRRPGPLTVTITAVGEVPAGAIVRRSGAEAGHRVFVTGTLGDAGLGLKLRRDPSLAARWRLGAEHVDHLLARYLRPMPRLAARAALAHAKAAMDLSDGLAKDAGRMAAASGVGIDIETTRLPLSDAARRALDADPALIEAVVAGGDDYEILTAVAEADAPAFVAAAQTASLAVTDIGLVRHGTGVALHGPRGESLSTGSTGWDHF